MKENLNELELFKPKDIPRMGELEDGTIVYSALDSVAVLTDSTNPSVYWSILKKRLKEEGDETFTKCKRLKLLAKDGKMRYTDCVTEEQLFRLIQSIPSPKAEPFKQWLAKVGSERLEEERNPSKAVHRAIDTYQRQGHSKKWANKRVKGIGIRNECMESLEPLVDHPEWQYGHATNTYTKEWSGFNTKQYKRFKNLPRDANLRDNMTSIELGVNSLVEEAVSEAIENKDIQNYDEAVPIFKKAGRMGRNVCKEIENVTGKPVVTSKNNLGYTGRGLLS